MKTVNNMLVLDAGDIDKPEYRAAAVAALQNGNSVSIPSVNFSLNMPNAQTVRLVDLNAGTEKLVTGLTATEVLDKVATYGSAERILAALGN